MRNAMIKSERSQLDFQEIVIFSNRSLGKFSRLTIFHENGNGLRDGYGGRFFRNFSGFPRLNNSLRLLPVGGLQRLPDQNPIQTPLGVQRTSAPPFMPGPMPAFFQMPPENFDHSSPKKTHVEHTQNQIFILNQDKPLKIKGRKLVEAAGVEPLSPYAYLQLIENNNQQNPKNHLNQPPSHVEHTWNPIFFKSPSDLPNFSIHKIFPKGQSKNE